MQVERAIELLAHFVCHLIAIAIRPRVHPVQFDQIRNGRILACAKTGHIVGHGRIGIRSKIHDTIFVFVVVVRHIGPFAIDLLQIAHFVIAAASGQDPLHLSIHFLRIQVRTLRMQVFVGGFTFPVHQVVGRIDAQRTARHHHEPFAFPLENFWIAEGSILQRIVGPVCRNLIYLFPGLAFVFRISQFYTLSIAIHRDKGNQTTFLRAEQTALIGFIGHDAAGEHGAIHIRIQGYRLFFPMDQIGADSMHPVHRSPLCIIIELIEHVILALVVNQSIGIVGPAFLDRIMVLAAVGFVIVDVVFLEAVNVQGIGTLCISIDHMHGDPVDAFGYRNIFPFLVGVAIFFKGHCGVFCFVCLQIDSFRIVFHILDPGGRFREELCLLVHITRVRAHSHIGNSRCVLIIQHSKVRILESGFGIPVEQPIISFCLYGRLSFVIFLQGVVAQIGNQHAVDPVLHVAINSNDFQMIGIGRFYVFFIDQLQSGIVLPPPEFGLMAARIHIDSIALLAIGIFAEPEQQAGRTRIALIRQVCFVNKVGACHFGQQESVAFARCIRN